MTTTELLTEVRAEMTGDPQTDLHRISEFAQRYKKETNAGELMEALAEFAYTLLPEPARRQMEDATFVRGKRMDAVFGEALSLMRSDRMEDAEDLLGAIAEKIKTHFENGEKKWFCFRNQFEFHMYRMYNPEDTNFDRAPFDFSHYLQTYAYVQFQNRKTRAALRSIDRAIRFNPVNIDVRFEQAEIFKFTRVDQPLLKCCQESLRIATTASCFARVLANMGYYCVMIGDLYSAAVFYFESLKFYSARVIEAELQDVLRRMKAFGQSFAPPTHGQTIDVYEKYGMTPPPNGELVSLAVTLGNSAHEHGRRDLEGLFFRTAYDMTNDPHFKEILDRIDAEIAAEEAQNA